VLDVWVISDIAVFVLKRDVKLQPTNLDVWEELFLEKNKRAQKIFHILHHSQDAEISTMTSVTD